MSGIWEITEKSWDKETRRLQKMGKTTATMGGSSEERRKKGVEGKVESKRQQQMKNKP